MLTRSFAQALIVVILSYVGTTGYQPDLVKNLVDLRDAALGSHYAYDQVAHLTENIGPRLSGSPQAQHAVDYVAGELRRLGLDVHLEKVQVPHWVRGAESGELTDFPGMAPGTTQKVVLTALGGSVSTPDEGLTANVVVAQDFQQLASMGRETVAGKIVLFNFPFDKRMAAEGYGGQAYGQAVAYRAAGPSAAARVGAVACLIRSVGNADYRLPHTGSLRYSDDAPRAPAAAVTAEDADLIAHLASQGSVRMHLLLTPRTLPDAPSYNVVADIKGSEHPEQVVIVSGHLDSWDLGTGAIDDAAGVAVAMETASLIRKLGLHPKRTIRVVAWMNEENGTAGAQAYARNHAAEVANHVGAIESDLGAGHPLGFYIYADKSALPLLEPVSQVLTASGAGVMTPSDTPVETDITPLELAGVPGFGLLQDSRTYFSYHHTSADTLDKIVPSELAENAAAMVVLAYALADMPDLLPRPPKSDQSGQH
ncbi:MAG TPA: M20/M25/M40 family metallo-hydrolase [Blastocatellia bacterium]|nr:M20/M25/M40 family metallo-hydrolase [Blastocatellia bacterium]